MLCDTWDGQWWCVVLYGNIMLEMLCDACDAMSCITLWHRCSVIHGMTSDDMCCVILCTLCLSLCVIHVMQWVVSYFTILGLMLCDDMCCIKLCTLCQRCCVMHGMQSVVSYSTHRGIDALWYMEWPVRICVVLYYAYVWFMWCDELYHIVHIVP